jgi:hypothetical protein
MHQPFIHMMQRSGDRNSCGYAGGPHFGDYHGYEDRPHIHINRCPEKED